jgi:GalNAc-alpha-(1->4)-GalNAc-alpha-(1->3)-diNAcBac-PP-undecaprenol alpha-1,4-N-acetyl-D-galactosaminyltransferase
MRDNSILFIAPSLKLGGLENAVCVMANYFASTYNVKLLTIYNHELFYSLHPNIQLVAPHFPKRGVPKWWYYLKVVLYLRKEIKKEKPDCILSYGDWSNILAIMANFGLGYKAYISDRASPGLKFDAHIHFLRKILYRRVDGIIAQTNRAKEQKVEMLGKNINVKVIPNPIRATRNYENIKKGEIVLAVARHYPVKGLDRLLKAFSLIQNTEWRLEIAGSEGPATPDLHKLVDESNLKERVKFLGSIKEIDKVYARASIFVLPSRSEGFPNALIEAMAAGLPCISFDINAGPSDIITHGSNGLLVPDGDIKKLAESIQQLISGEQLRFMMGKEAKKIRGTLSIEKIGEQFEAFIFEKNVS